MHSTSIFVRKLSLIKTRFDLWKLFYDTINITLTLLTANFLASVTFGEISFPALILLLIFSTLTFKLNRQRAIPTLYALHCKLYNAQWTSPNLASIFWWLKLPDSSNNNLCTKCSGELWWILRGLFKNIFVAKFQYPDKIMLHLSHTEKFHTVVHWFSCRTVLQMWDFL